MEALALLLLEILDAGGANRIPYADPTPNQPSPSSGLTLCLLQGRVHPDSGRQLCVRAAPLALRHYRRRFPLLEYVSP